MSAIGGAARGVFASIDPDAPTDAVLLFKKNGDPLGSWTRQPGSQDVLTVMAAVTLGSIETIVETLGGPSPKDLMIETDVHRLLFTKVDPQIVLVLIGSKSQSETSLRRTAQRLLKQLSTGHANPVSADAPGGGAPQEAKRRERFREDEPHSLSW